MSDSEAVSVAYVKNDTDSAMFGIWTNDTEETVLSNEDKCLTTTFSRKDALIVYKNIKTVLFGKE